MIASRTASKAFKSCYKARESVFVHCFHDIFFFFNTGKLGLLRDSMMRLKKKMCDTKVQVKIVASFLKKCISSSSQVALTPTLFGSVKTDPGAVLQSNPAGLDRTTRVRLLEKAVLDLLPVVICICGAKASGPTTGSE